MEQDATLTSGGPPRPDDDEGRALRRATARAALFGGEPEPVQVGRYTLLRQVGVGGMGTVFAAYDQQLGRTVAVKLMHRDRGQGRARLLREAQALARLSHPNVVAVHEVGAVGDRVFVAMEFVEGRTLEDVMHPNDGPRRPWQQLLPLLIQAGRGLAAAHAAGIVHRDFKPSNVMVGADGRVRVVDFGIARTDVWDEPDTIPEDQASRTLARLTVTGGVMGTPRYMSPEQFRGEPVDARSDQFSFCVVLYEALHGQGPFAARTLSELAEVVSSGNVRPPPSNSGVPRRIEQAIRRGLAATPAARYPSMEALLVGLSLEPSARRGRAIMVLGLAGALATGLWAGGAGADTDRCSGGADELTGAWDAAAKRRAEQGLRGTGRDHAVGTWQRVEAWGDAWAGRWLTAWRGACELHVRGDRSDADLEQQRTCLQGQVHALRSLVDGLATADQTVLDRATAAIRALPEPAGCGDRDRGSALPADPEARSQLAAAEAGLAAARAALALDRVAGAREALVEVERIAEALDDRRLRAEVGLHRGILARRGGDLPGAEALWSDAYFAAAAAGETALTIELAALLMRVTGADLGRIADARQWERHAAAALARGTASPEAGRTLALARIAVLLAQGHTIAAEDALMPILRGAEDATGLAAAELLLRLGDVRVASGELELAAAAYADAGSYDLGVLGPEHPGLGHVRFAQARLSLARGEVQAARVGFEDLLSFWTDRLGPSHLDVAAVHFALAQVATVQADGAEALDHYARAHGIYAAAHGSEHVRTALAACGLALRFFGRDQAPGGRGPAGRERAAARRPGRAGAGACARDSVPARDGDGGRPAGPPGPAHDPVAVRHLGGHPRGAHARRARRSAVSEEYSS
ncbi:serine/threonine-protein kinase [Nannocystis radixulma]|uniref:non-specific serine/threonine protein kinase n=1 Tax=Nannocystis radixulma TaxID=2995305 RepID=A0ABT5BN28_9BACT|nr:serine/threonine-protein kinase [Nannocystis radixulma]MDC0675579.1 serine/threonine-protein kinase [Nannocystis radixulma]